MKLAGVSAVGLAMIAVMAVPRTQVAWVQPAADVTNPVIVKLIGDGELQVASPDDDTEITVEAISSDQPVLVFSDHPLIATAPCVAAQDASQVQCPFDRVTSVLVLTSAGNDEVVAIVPVPVTVITGGGNDDVFSASVKNDLFLLGDGDDAIRIAPGAGASDVFGGPGRDQVSYDLPLELFEGVSISLDDIANDGPSAIVRNDNIRSDVETLVGGVGNDILIGSDSSNLILGGPGNDTIRGLGGDDTMNGEGTFFLGDLYTDLIDGGAGTDTVSYDDRSAAVNVSLDGVANDGDPTIGEADNVLNTENIVGGNGNDTLTGNAGGNTIRGLGGDDTIAGGAGADVIDGGAGTDTATYADRLTAVAVSLDGLANDGSTGERDNVINTENLIGGGGNDTLTGSAGANFIRGLAGNDQLRGLAGNDLLIGDTGTDFADGGAGDDLCRAEQVVSCP
jgi:Ca2+-binding RTX toxin-like protein